MMDKKTRRVLEEAIVQFAVAIEYMPGGKSRADAKSAHAALLALRHEMAARGDWPPTTQLRCAEHGMAIDDTGRCSRCDRVARVGGAGSGGFIDKA
jgi:hypothetical protein